MSVYSLWLIIPSLLQLNTLLSFCFLIILNFFPINADFRTALEDTDYGNFLQDEALPLAVDTISTKCRAKMASEFQHLRSMSQEPLVKFLDFIT